jgi:hypothetical protein
MEKSINLFDNVIDEQALERLDKETLDQLLKILDKVK